MGHFSALSCCIRRAVCGNVCVVSGLVFLDFLRQGVQGCHVAIKDSHVTIINAGEWYQVSLEQNIFAFQ